MRTLRVSKTMYYTDYFLVEVPDGEEVDTESLYSFIKSEEPEPYYTQEEHMSGDIDWTEVPEMVAKDIEHRSGVKRYRLEEPTHD